MKSVAVFFILLVTVICCSFQYAEWRNIAPDNEVDKVVRGVGGIKQYLPSNRRITFICPDNNATLYGMCRYVLAPRYLSFKEGKLFDTALVITRIDTSIGKENTIIANRKVLWQHKDSLYHYYLTCPL